MIGVYEKSISCCIVSLLNFLIIFYYLMLNQIFPRLSTKIFRILHKLDENNHLNSSCRFQSWSGLYIYNYHLRAHHKIEYTAQNNTNFYTFISASGTTSSGKKQIWQKEKILWPPIYTINVETRKRLHDIPRFFDSLPRTRNINYYIQNMQHLFTFLAPRNLNWTSIDFFSCSTSGWASDRLVGVFNRCFGCSKEPYHWDGSFEYPQHMFRLRNKTNNLSLRTWHKNQNWATTRDFQQCGILTSVDSDEPVQPSFKLRNSKWCSVSSLTIIQYSSD